MSFSVTAAMLARRTAGSSAISRGALNVARRSGRVALLSSGPPKLSDSLVEVNFVDYKGDWFTCRGHVGQNLVDCAALNGHDFLDDDSSAGGGLVEKVHDEQWTEDLFGEGPVSAISHVVVAGQWMDKLPPASWKEEAVLKDHLHPDDLTPRSRLGTEITLAPELDGLVVYVPDSPPLE